MDSRNYETKHPSFFEALLFWLKLGFISFGGPSGQIAIMHQELVERRRWISEDRFFHALNYCMLLPGPEAQQLATYIGWLLHKTKGGIVAGALFVLPSALILWALSFIYVRYGDAAGVVAVLYGLKPAVLGIVLAALFKIGSRALKNSLMWSFALLAFIALSVFNVPFPIVIISALFIGFVGSKYRPDLFIVLKSHGPVSSSPSSAANPSIPQESPTLGSTVKVALTIVALWWLPILVVGIWLGTTHTLFQQGLFFSKAAMVTFGGAYAVLPYVAQQAVEQYSWLSTAQMLDGLGLAETTPGPLIMVLQFVGFLGGWNHPGGLPPIAAATLGAAVTTWATFLPCFLWIFLGAPHIERLLGNERLTAALSTVTASVVGVILNLAVWFGLHVLFPSSGDYDFVALTIAILAFVALHRFKVGIIPLIVTAAVAGYLARTLA